MTVNGNSNYFYTEDHEWIALSDDGVGFTGVSAYAAGQLGEVVYVELPEVGAEIVKGKEVSVVESVKAASDVFAPASGEILEVNSDLEGSPEIVNESPEESGWIYKLKLSNTSELEGLMNADSYLKFCKGL